MKSVFRLHKSDEEFIEGIRNEDTLLMNALYRLHFKMVLYFIICNGGDEQEAKDIYQEGFIVLYKNLRKNDFDLQCSIKTYLYSVCRRLWLNELKLKSRNALDIRDVENFFMIEEPEEPDFFAAVNNHKLVKKCLAELGDPCATVITDFYVTRLTMQKIAEKMGYTNEDNAKNQKYKCLQRLKKIFFGYYAPEKRTENER